MTTHDEFFRFPHTPHLVWLGTRTPRADKVLTPNEVSRFLASDLIVEEKVDGANVGVSVDANGQLRGQNRGSFIGRSAHPQFRPLQRWLADHHARLAPELGRDLILFGEWCFAVHTIEYTALPDWFLGFDVYDRQVGHFWSVDRRNALCSRAGVQVVPELGRGRFNRVQLLKYLKGSYLGARNIEGIYVRTEKGGFLSSRAKIVQESFQQAISEHWTARTMKTNKLREQ